MATYTVKVRDYDGENKFQVNGSRQKVIHAASGEQVVFDQSDASNAGHPLRIALYPDGAHLTNGSEYTTGVTSEGTPGAAGAKTTFTVSNTDLHGTYFYYCENHRYMGGVVHYGSDSIPLNETVPAKYRLIDEGATASDVQDGDITSNIVKTIEQYNETTLEWEHLAEISGNSISHTNPWAIINTDTRNTVRYRIIYGVTDSAGLAAVSRSRTMHITSALPTLQDLVPGTTFWLVNGLDENGKGYGWNAGKGDPSLWENYHYNGFCICNPAGGSAVKDTSRAAGGSLYGHTVTWADPNHARYPPMGVRGYTLFAYNWRGQVTILDDGNYIAWSHDEAVKVGIRTYLSEGEYTQDDTGITIKLRTINGLDDFKIYLTSTDQLEDGAITRCSNLQRILFTQTMSMISAIKCGEGDVPPTSERKADVYWGNGYSDIEFDQYHYQFGP